MTTKPTNNEWLEATVETIVDESPNVKTFSFRAPRPIIHLAGQHYELRLTAENGYQAARLYSAATPSTEGDLLTLGIMRVPNGEVSPYVVDQLQVGDRVEIRGPFGRFFTWSPDVTQPIFLIGGGSGVIPIHAIYAAHQQSASKSGVQVLYSEHRFEDILFKDELLDRPDVTITLTKKWPKDWKGPTGRVTLELVKELVKKFPETPLCYVCGMNGFVNAVSDGLQQVGIPAASIKTERFG